jgi:hypothetical protein
VKKRLGGVSYFLLPCPGRASSPWLASGAGRPLHNGRSGPCLTSGCTRHEPLASCIAGLYFSASRFVRVNRKAVRRLMPRTKLALLILVGSVLAACDQPYDRSRVDRPLTELREPYRTIDAAYFLDGGSVGVSLTDRDGRHQFFFVSAKLDEPNPYSRVFVGRIPAEGAAVPEVRDPDPTKRRLAEILRSKKNRTREEDICVARLSNSKFYSLRAAARGLLGDD